MMKIAIDVSPVLPGGKNGGIKQLLWELLKGFEKKAISDEFILLTSYKNHQIFEEFDKFQMQRLCIIKDSLVNQNFLRRCLNRIVSKKLKFFNTQGILKKNRISVLFCPFAAPTFSEIGIPTVSIVTDLQHLYYPFFFSKQEFNIRNFFYGLLKKKVDYVIAISSFTRKTITEKLNISPDKIFTIPISIQSRFRTPQIESTSSILEKFNLNKKKYCVYLSNLWPHKNHKMLLVAFNMFQKRCPQFDLHLLLTGEKIESDKILEDSVKQMGLEDKVHFTGYLLEEELAEIWHQSYFLIFPSLFEGFGIPLVEAMRYKKPILASNVTSIPEVAENAAIYFDPKKPAEIFNSLCRVMEDKNLYDLLVKRGQEQLKKYNFEEMIDRYIDILHKVGENKEEKNQVIVSGVFNDGWAGGKIQIAFSKYHGKRTFEIKGFLPEWLPMDQMRIKVDRYNKSSQHHLRKGKELHIKEQLPSKNGKLTIFTSRSFRPKKGDTRRLSFRVKEFLVLDEETGEKLYEFRET